MPLLSTSEALHVSDSFLSSLYGDVIFRRWKELKDEMNFVTEREYVSWLIDVANHYKNEDETQQLSQEANTNQFKITNVKSEQDLDHYNQGQGQSYETPVSEYSNVPPTRVARNSKNYVELDVKAEGAGNYNEQTSVTSQVDDYKYEQSYYDDVREDERMLEMDDDEGEGGDDGQLTQQQADDQTSGSEHRVEHSSVPGNESGRRLLEPRVSPPKRYPCPHCSYSSGRSHHLKDHILAIHEKRKPFPCPHCNYRCSRKSSLKVHLINRHGRKSKYRCNQCGKFFESATKLRGHSHLI